MSNCGISRLVTAQDFLGHYIGLNFDRKGQVYRTFLGGTISILVKLLMLAFGVHRIVLMIQEANFRHQMYVKQVDLSQIGNMPLYTNDSESQSLDLLPYFQFLHTETLEPFTYSELQTQGIQKYITMNYIDI